MDAARIKATIRDEALRLGFDAVGFAAPDMAEATRAGLARFLEQGFHGEMDWLADRAEQRASPKDLWPAVKSVVVLGLNYAPVADPLSELAARDRGYISVYARGRDYHDLIKGRLKTLAQKIAARWGSQLKVFVDTAPVMEKPLAQAGGVGWQGKHTNLVSREFGSWLFLGEIYLDLALPPDAAEDDYCGECRRCLEVCPTNAFPGPYRLDARRCISYLTIEHKGPIDAELRPLMGTRIFGCDDCLAVCPWNKFAVAARESGLKARPALTGPELAALARLDDSGFRKLFAASPVKRIGRDRFMRNVLIAIGNSGDPALVESARVSLDDPSPLVRAMAVWALKRLDPAAAKTLRETYLTRETDPAVRAEWAV
ncbi:MAG: tRNA epoxyqueuosine(34) reductase QueG [Alphaproteobacteria bacterium]|nr:tRNA epoxyqueuosine(34) reductase QueG [Alphaproteobacteria bacterium]